MKTQTLFVVVLLLLQCSVTAQVNYSVKESNPANYREISVKLKPFDVRNFHGFLLGSSLSAEAIVNKTIMPYVNLFAAWVDDPATRKNEEYYPDAAGGRHPSRMGNIGATWFFADKDHDKDIKVVLERRSTGRNTVTERYTMVPGAVTRMLGIDGGVGAYRKALKLEQQMPINFVSMDGKTVVPISSSSSGNNPVIYGDQTVVYVMSHSQYVYGGLRYRNIRNMVINTQRYGVRENRAFLDFYADVIYTPTTNISHAVTHGNVEWQMVLDPSLYSHWGYKCGITRQKRRTPYEIGYTFEMGNIPGTRLNNSFQYSGAYFSLSVDCALNFSTHPHQKKEEQPEQPEPQHRRTRR